MLPKATPMSQRFGEPNYDYKHRLKARVEDLERMLHSTKAMLDEVAQAAGFRTGDSYSAQAIIRALRKE